MKSLLKPLPFRQAEKQIANAGSYSEWAEAAQMHDEITGRKEWKKEERSSLYDYQIIRTRLQGLRRCRLNGDDKGLLFTLNEGIHGNMGGMGSVALYTVAKFGTKELINEYIDEIVSAVSCRWHWSGWSTMTTRKIKPWRVRYCSSSTREISSEERSFSSC